MSVEGDLVARFVRELEMVSGRAMTADSEVDAAPKFCALAHSANVRSVAVGRGVATDLGPIADALRRDSIEVVQADRVGDSDRLAIRDRIARCDAGLAEADYGIAATGTLAVAADATRPGSLTLLPPLSVVVLRTERIVPDLATLFDRIGPRPSRRSGSR